MTTQAMPRIPNDSSLSRRRMVQSLGATGAASLIPGAIRGAGV